MSLNMFCADPSHCLVHLCPSQFATFLHARVQESRSRAKRGDSEREKGRESGSEPSEPGHGDRQPGRVGAAGGRPTAGGRERKGEGGQTTNFTYLDTFREVSPVVRARKVCHFPLSFPLSSLSMPFPSIFPSTLSLSCTVGPRLSPSLRRPQPIGIRWFVRVRFTLPFEKGAIASHSTHLVPCIPPSFLPSQ